VDRRIAVGKWEIKRQRIQDELEGPHADALGDWLGDMGEEEFRVWAGEQGITGGAMNREEAHGATARAMAHTKTREELEQAVAEGIWDWLEGLHPVEFREWSDKFGITWEEDE
jgi:hypothetical protein